MQIEWEPPPPRAGWRGVWDRFIGPGATRSEFWLQLIGAGGGAALLVIFTIQQWDGTLTALQAGVVALLAFDLSGGVITNATATAKRWYHRRGQGWAQHMAFVAPHGLHLAALVWAFPELGWWFALLSYAYLLAATISVLAAPLYLQRPIALSAYIGVVLIDGWLAPPTALAWVLPIFFLKLLVAHILKEAPFTPSQERTTHVTPT